VSVSRVDAWRKPGCGLLCRPPSHDYVPHEAFGRLLEREERARARTPQQRHIIRTGPMIVDLELKTVTVNGQPVSLTLREWELLAYYAQRRGGWCSGRDIVEAIWGEGHTRVAAISRLRLRRQLGAAGHLIETQRAGGRGYQWTRLKLTEPTP
jgi:DNA-binding response OmpR family regulator